MTAWEYLVDASLPSGAGDAGQLWAERLNELGPHGWELVSDHRLELQYGQIQYVGTLKRLLTSERAAEREAQAAAHRTGPTPARMRALDELVEQGLLSVDEARLYAPDGRVDDAAWEALQERFGLN